MLHLFKSPIILAFITILLVGCKKDDDLSNGNYTIVWRGFHHVWEYNHRVNRMGDWIDDISNSNGFLANAYHSAASGIGPDKNEYISYFTTLKTSSAIQFNNLKKEILFKGEEGTIDSQFLNLSVELPLINNAKAIVLLNGFDMYARPEGSDQLVGDGGADKLFDLSLNTSNIIITNTSNSTIVSFDLIAKMGMDCTSPECSSGIDNDWFDYLLTAYFQVILAESSTLQQTDKQLATTYEWGKPMNNNANEIFQDNFVLRDITIQGNAGYNIGFPGIKGFTFKTYKGLGGFLGQDLEYPHMQTYNMSLRPLEYNKVSGIMKMEADLFFKNWAAPIPIFSFGGGGSMEMKVETSLIQINDAFAKLEHFEFIDDIIWLINPTNPLPSNAPLSVKKLPIISHD